MSTSIDMSVYGLANAYYYPPLLMRRPHRHNEVEMNFVEQGSITYLFGSERASVQAGQTALFWATIPHQLILFEGQAILHWVTIPFATFLQWQLPDVLTRQIIRGKFVTDVVLDEKVALQAGQAQFQQWYADLQQESEEYRKIVLLEIEARLRRMALSIGTHQSKDSALQAYEMTKQGHAGELSNVERVACFIAEHYTESLHVEQIAQIVHLHPNYMMSLFRKSFGMSIIDYITQYRISHAQRLLITTDANVSEIALESGFGSVSRFYTAFKAVCGQSPAAYRASLRGGNMINSFLNE